MKKFPMALAVTAALLLTGCRAVNDPPEGWRTFEPTACPTARVTVTPFGTSPVTGETAEPAAYTVTAEEFVSLREAPDPAARCVRRLEAGMVVYVSGWAGDFARVTAPDTGETGYALAAYLTPGILEAGRVEGIAAGRWYEAQVQEYLSLRVAPDTAAERVAKLDPGTLVRVLDVGDGFARVQVRSTGARGYVMSQYLRWTEEQPAEDDLPALSAGRYAVLCREYVSLRAGASGDAARLVKLEPGTRVLVLDSEGEYARVRVEATGREGYALTEYLTPAGEAPAKESDYLEVRCEEYLSLREAPDTASARLDKLPPGTRVRLLSREGDFARIRVETTGREGYVLCRYLAAGGGEPDMQTGGEAVYSVLCREYLTVRDSPSTSAEALGRLYPGDRVRVSGYDGLFARVTRMGGGLSGYVLAGYLAAQDDPYLTGLSIVQPDETYSYEQMLHDIRALQKAYPGQIRVESAGTSGEGRDIPVLVVGDPAAGHHILIHAGIHGREHMTSLLVMAQTEYCLKFPGAAYADGTVGMWLENVCLHILPMVNPDGVTISQQTSMTDVLRAVYERDLQNGRTDESPEDYLRLWKANGTGVDINRNFDAGWERLEGPDAPSFSRYRGQAPEDQPETRALTDYTGRYDFDATLSYHASGSCLYWQYGDDARVNSRSRDLARALGDCTGYPLAGSDGLDAGGYKDWAMETLGIASVTLEIGGRACPLPLDEFASVYERNRNVFAAAARWVGED